jgi:DNA invertase Pin-like site-specific DNA recombinase
MNDARTRSAAQYIRMSTDRQDLSPLFQRDAIAKFAAANGVRIVCSYEDEGKSGVDLANRPQMRQLLQDVTAKPPFSEILVYDVSRWGRFQDEDAAGHWEYHCRSRGVQVVYVSETFANDRTPASVLLKNMRRVMASEYSKDIALKSRAGQERVVSMGFQMGKLPPFGYRRCSVASGGSRRTLLEHGQRKLTLTDRIEWVLAPAAELDMVRRICARYASGFRLDELAALITAEGWHREDGGTINGRALRTFLANEVLIGNFVWGRRSKGGKILTCAPTRMDGSVPRIIEDTTWSLVQHRLEQEAAADRARRARTQHKAASAEVTKPKQLSLPLRRTDLDGCFRRGLGEPWQLQNHAREFGRALCAALLQRGLPAAFDTRTIVLTFWDARVRIRLMWPSDPSSWQLERSRSVTDVSTILVARMAARSQPLDFFLVPAHSVPPALLKRLPEQVPKELRKFRCADPDELVRRLTKDCQQTPLHPAKGLPSRTGGHQ